MKMISGSPLETISASLMDSFSWTGVGEGGEGVGMTGGVIGLGGTGLEIVGGSDPERGEVGGKGEGTMGFSTTCAGGEIALGRGRGDTARWLLFRLDCIIGGVTGLEDGERVGFCSGLNSFLEVPFGFCVFCSANCSKVLLGGVCFEEGGEVGSLEVAFWVKGELLGEGLLITGTGEGLGTGFRTTDGGVEEVGSVSAFVFLNWILPVIGGNWRWGICPKTIPWWKFKTLRNFSWFPSETSVIPELWSIITSSLDSAFYFKENVYIL